MVDAFSLYSFNEAKWPADGPQAAPGDATRMRMKCNNPQCGREFDGPPGNVAPKFCIYCGQGNLASAEPADPVGVAAPSASAAASHAASGTAGRPLAIGTLVRGGASGPPPPEPDDVPLLRVPAAPPSLITDDEVRAPATAPGPTAGDGMRVSAAALSPIADDEVYMVLGTGPVDEAEEPASHRVVLVPGAESLRSEGEVPEPVEPAVPVSVQDELFKMLEAQLPENIEMSEAAAPASDPDAEALAFKDEETPAPGTEAPEPTDTEAELASKEGDARPPAAPRKPRTPIRDLPSAVSLLGDISTEQTPDLSQLDALLAESVSFPLKGRGPKALVLTAAVWLAGVALVWMGQGFVAIPIVALILLSCLGTMVVAIGLGSTGRRGSISWPFAAGSEGWASLSGYLARFLLILAATGMVGWLASRFAKGFVPFLPVMLVTGALIVCLDPDWRAVFDPRRHLALLARAPVPMLKAVTIGLTAGLVLPAAAGWAVAWLLDCASVAVLWLVVWYAMAGPLAWYCAAVTGYALGLLWYESREALRPGPPPKPYEAGIGVGVLILAVLFSLLLM